MSARAEEAREDRNHAEYGLAGYPDSYYAASVGPVPERARLRGAAECDVCVVGGGFSGLSTALELADRGYTVRVLEARRIGWGATGRCGGQIVSGYNPSMAKIISWVGLDTAKELFAMNEEGKRIIQTRVGRHAIACDLKHGYVFAATKRRQIAEMAEEAEIWSQRFGYNQTAVLDRDGMAAQVASSRYPGGVYDAGGGHLHPLKYALGVADAAEMKHTMIHENTPVTGLEPGARPIVRTPEGHVRARFVVFCGNAYIGAPVPRRIRSRIMPVGTYIGVTEPLLDTCANRLLPTDAAVADLNFVLDYYRLTADRRLLFGGRVSYSTLDPRNLKGAMRRSILKVFPQLNAVRVDYAWGGHVAITMDRVPDIGRISDTVFYAQGYSGHGVVLTQIAGRVIAEAIAGQAERLDVFGRLPITAFPGGRLLRVPALVAAMSYLRLRDML